MYGYEYKGYYIVDDSNGDFARKTHPTTVSLWTFTSMGDGWDSFTNLSAQFNYTFSAEAYVDHVLTARRFGLPYTLRVPQIHGFEVLRYENSTIYFVDNVPEVTRFEIWEHNTNWGSRMLASFNSEVDAMLWIQSF